MVCVETCSNEVNESWERVPHWEHLSLRNPKDFVQVTSTIQLLCADIKKKSNFGK